MVHHMATLKILVNDRWIEPIAASGSPAIDFIRGERGLTGTKEGCREGDCGACAVLVGEFAKLETGGSGSQAGPMGAEGPFHAPRYRAIPSCLLALGDLAGKHLVTIEGLGGNSPEGLTPVMRAFLEENASQCGFCSPGFIISLSAWLAGSERLDLASAMVAVDGNLCRCTGYGAIRRAAERLCAEFADLPEPGGARLGLLVERGVLPRSALLFMEEGGPEAGAGNTEARPLVTANPSGEGEGPGAEAGGKGAIALGGGTDYFVRNPDPGPDFKPLLLRSFEGTTGISQVRIGDGDWIRVGAATVIGDFFASPLVRQAVPGIEAFEGEFASTLIRNLATLGGNIANASPVGDLTAMMMSLGAVLELGAPSLDMAASRSLPIEEFFLGYKRVALEAGEIIRAILIPAPETPVPGAKTGKNFENLRFSFEKIAKRKNLDIAAVNTAISFRIVDGRIHGARISAGGVAATPMLLREATAALEGVRIADLSVKELAVLARAVSAAAEKEVSPIDDVRGQAAYRKRMTGRLVLAHFLRLFEEAGIAKELFP